MKTLLLIILLTALLVGVDVFVVQQNTWRTEALEKGLCALEDAVRANDYPTASAAFTNLEQTWDSLKPLWETIVPHEHTETIARSILELKMYIERSDGDDILATTADIRSCLSHISESLSFSAANFF